MKYQLIDATTSDMVGFYDDFDDALSIVRHDLLTNGVDSVRTLNLLIGNDEGPLHCIEGEDLAEYVAQEPSFFDWKVGASVSFHQLADTGRQVAVSITAGTAVAGKTFALPTQSLWVFEHDGTSTGRSEIATIVGSL